MIYINSDTTFLFPDLHQKGEAVNTSTTYTINLVGIEETVTITDDQQPIKATERYFCFEVPNIPSTAPDGLYTFQVFDGESKVYEETAYLQLKTTYTYASNTPTNTYFVNEQ